MPKPKIGLDLSLDEIMYHWPNAISVFLKHKMLCVGCPIASIHTLDDACREYNLDIDDFIAEILAA